MFKERVAYWSGPSAAAGGILQLLPTSGWFPNIADTTQLWIGLIGFGLTAVGLAGLYLHFRADETRGSVMAIGLALAGVLLVSINMVIRLIKGAEETASILILVAIGMLLLIVGLTIVGIITISRHALGMLSFVPLALGIGYIAIMISFGLVLSSPSLVFIAQIVHTLTIVGWLLLGVALWQAHREFVVPKNIGNAQGSEG